MTQAQEFLFVVCGLYLVECVSVIPRDAWVLWGIGLRGLRITPSHRLPGAADWGLFLRFPLPPLGSIHIVRFWPLSMSPNGISAVPAYHPGPPKERESHTEFVPFDAVNSVAVDGNHLLVNGRRLAHCLSPFLAEHLVQFLRRLVALAPSQRESAIRREIQAAFSVAEAGRTFQQFNQAGARPRFDGSVLLLLMFALVPAVVWYLGLARTWLPLLIGLLLCWVLVCVDYYQAHKSLWPSRTVERRHRCLLLALTPLGAVRAVDHLMKDCFARFHPLAAAQVVCRPEAFQQFAGDTLRDLTFACGELAGPEDASPAAAAAHWFRRQLLGEATALIREVGLEPERLLAPPEAEDPDSRAYCPRCVTQFRHDEGECPYCPGVRLRVLPADAASTAKVNSGEASAV